MISSSNENFWAIANWITFFTKDKLPWFHKNKKDFKKINKMKKMQ